MCRTTTCHPRLQNVSNTGVASRCLPRPGEHWPMARNRCAIKHLSPKSRTISKLAKHIRMGSNPAPATKDTCRERSSDSDDLFVLYGRSQHGRQIPAQLDMERLA